MNEGKNTLIGILAIILGLIVIVFPLVSVLTFSVLMGLGIIFLGIWFFTQSFHVWEKNLAAGIADLLLGIIAILFGIVFLGDVRAFEFLTFLAIYIVGLFLIIAGLMALFSGKDLKARVIGILGIIFGILYFILGMYVANPLFLAIIIGAFLILAGIMEIFIVPSEKQEISKKSS
jgi:membrane protein HdeD